MGFVGGSVSKLVEVDERFGNREEEWGCDLVVGIGVVAGGILVGLSPICGIEAVRAQWSLWLVVIGVMVVLSICGLLWAGGVGASGLAVC